MRGSAVWLIYWKKACTTPTVMVPLSMAQPEITAITTWPSRLSIRMRGLTQLVRKSAFWLAARLASAASDTFRMLSASWL